MAKILIFLLCLLLKSNVYAEDYIWWNNCNWTWTTSGWHCIIYEQPTCQNQTEYQTISCPVHQSGSINQTRTFTCGTQSWSAWTTTSTNCTQDPPTCVSTIETRQLACAAGYTGLIQEQRSSICSDPYGSPTWTSWSITSDTCTMTKTNPNNVESPVSPVSPVSIITPVQTMPTDTATVVQSAPIVTSTPETTTSSSNADTKPQDNPKVQELIPGLGLVLSIGMLTNSSLNITQPSMADSYNLDQENEYGLQQGIYMGLISETTVLDRWNFAISRRANSFYRNYNLQQNGFGN